MVVLGAGAAYAARGTARASASAVGSRARTARGDLGPDPRSRTDSSSGTAKVDSCALAVSTRHASGSPTVAQTT
jgi:hypothetical protein